jgi:hypothetical protein
LLTYDKVREYTESIASIIAFECAKAPVAGLDEVQSLGKSAIATERIKNSESNRINDIRKDKEDFGKWNGGHMSSLEELQLAKIPMTTGTAFRLFCDNLRIWVFPIMSEYIGSVIGTSMKPTRGLYVVDCKVSWEVLRYCEEELSGTRNLEEVITITGSPYLAQATPAVDYVDTIWGDEGLHLLRFFTRSLDRDACGKLFAQYPLALIAD